ncbi:hypothetical protein QQS21_008839 [Conoideocrella luteorostrata]|uniref:Aminoglycoside phosphotransferase domain-containing protein n=1 Tax=Conoideocrella luteorostrata TaxID=1105319 RepID=A0AAJ0CMI5_9HYPO|nr:hypothetical protein QQS21_008839 [Conoideocrella luteorostrata]
MSTSMKLPSTRWTSFNGWDYNGMKERLQEALEKVDKSVLILHAERIKGQKVAMSQPFSAGQYWICFEMIAEDGSLIIARVYLPRHPDSPNTMCDEDKAYAIVCEATTMEFVKKRLPSIPIPSVYTYEGPKSQLAADAGAMYMLIEGFYGNTLQDVSSNICDFPASDQEHIMAQWTRVQAELATLAYPQIGSICSFSEDGEPIIGKLPAFAIGELSEAGPFSRAVDYFVAIANAAIDRLKDSARLGAFVFRDILHKTDLFADQGTNVRFPLNHMDLGAQNILVNDRFDFIAIIDWEFAQTAPWQVNHFPMPFPLLTLDPEVILQDPNHLAYKNILSQSKSQSIYTRKFKEAEKTLDKEGRSLDGSFADTLNGSASRIYACFTQLGRVPLVDAELVRDMVQLAFGLVGDEVEGYLRDLERRMVL